MTPTPEADPCVRSTSAPKRFVVAFPRAAALLGAVGLVWLLSMVLPYAVIAEWGVVPWSLAMKLWAWSAGELLIAGIIGSLICPMPGMARRT